MAIEELEIVGKQIIICLEATAFCTTNHDSTKKFISWLKLPVRSNGLRIQDRE